MGCLDKHTEGLLEVMGENLNSLNENQQRNMRLHHLGFVFQVQARARRLGRACQRHGANSVPALNAFTGAARAQNPWRAPFGLNPAAGRSVRSHRREDRLVSAVPLPKKFARTCHTPPRA